ncbi:DNA translocase FtsK [Acidocella aminolytica]|jgi:S-DNA-T family DNA segregation ATPase FtsK/SpoIIIE|uniref:DNA translocase FtsK n=1 Tax=Acidocella aminolytica 101 = DSM 11237 TaxID=1120923 RepID=A0A0D6PDN7_9PROT|nr:DNA translocase FtsK [Acidocella aminolytica]GAN79313.1 cell division DNA translocase FtsK [Acidocella aminolytica 101 = DSM 11237]
MAVDLGARRFISPAIRAQMRRRAGELSAILIALVALTLALALVSYHPADSSFDTIGSGPVHNFAGMTGAAIADLMLQTFGMAGFIPVLVLLAWAYRLGVRGQIGHLRGRIVLAAVSMPLTAAALAMAFHVIPGGSLAWPVPAGPGGAAGDILSGFATGAGSSVLGKLGRGLVLLLTLLLALGSFGFALGFTPGEWRTGGRRAILAASASVQHGKRGAEAMSSWLAPLLQTVSASAPEIESNDTSQAWVPLRGAASDADDEFLQPVVSAPSLPSRGKPTVKPAVATRPSAPQQQRLPLPEIGWEPPSLDLLRLAPPRAEAGPSADALQNNARLLETVLQDYGVQGKIVEIRPGPVVTLYELEPAPGIRSARVVGLAEDIARSLSVISVRIAVVAGRNVIGIEVPNARRETVYLSELIGAVNWGAQTGALSLALGKDISGAPVIADLSRMPHLLIAGTTGSGKSVGVNAMIMSLLFKLSPEQCRLIMIDPKILELSVYDGIPHLLTPVVTEPPKAVAALKWVVREMDRRYRAMSQLSVRNIGGYNDRVNEARARGEVVTRRVQTGFDSETGKPVFEEQPLALEPLPFIVVFIDEMADLMLVAGKEIEICVQRLAQKARAAGIHVIMATQRPSVDVITGTIKANFPTRISFQVISKFDSRTILGEQGAEQLLGQGDLLYMAGGGRVTRVHGPFVSDQEVEAVVDYLREQGEPNYLDEVTEPSDDEESPSAGGGAIGGNTTGENALYDQAVAIVARDRKASTSYLQRCLTIGYNRAAKLIEQMEKEGVVSPANHVGKREVLVRAERDDE